MTEADWGAIPNIPEEMRAVLRAKQADFVNMQGRLASREVVGGHLFEAVVSMKDQLAMQEAVKAVKAFSGKPKELKGWLGSVEQEVRTQFGEFKADIAKRIAHRCSVGIIRDFVYTRLTSNSEEGWEEFKEEIMRRFGSREDDQTLLINLRKFVQRQGQSVQIFGEVLYRRGQEIFGDGFFESTHAQAELINIFVDGLVSRNVAATVVRRRPNKLEAAVQAAMEAEDTEFRLKARGLGGRQEARRQEEPMEIDQVGTLGNGRADGQQGRPMVRKGAPANWGNRQRGSRPNDVPLLMRGQRRAAPPRGCYNCGAEDHWARDCRQPRVLRCFRCGTAGHVQRNCRSHLN